MPRFHRLRLAVLLVAALPALAGCNEAVPSEAAPPPPAVSVAKPAQRSLADQQDFVGRFVAVDAVELRARVSGYLDAVHFRDGQLVHKGDLLFTIDRRPFEAALAQAQASLAQAQANLAFADSDLARGQRLVHDNTITPQVYEQRQQAKRVAEAAVAAGKAAVTQAALDLGFTEIRAPIDGRIGDRQVAPGNLVTGGSQGTTLLATINSVDPIRFEFRFDEAAYLRYREMVQGSGQAAPPVALELLGEQGFPHAGHMDFVDTVVDPATGTVRGRAQFANPDGRFTPGLFGRLRLALSAPRPVYLVPQAAIASEATRKYVYVVGADNVARQKYVALGPVVDGQQVVETGLSSGDRVVVNGLMRIRPGAKVTPQPAGTPVATLARPSTTAAAD